MEIKRQNFVTTIDFYVTTLIKKFLKKNVATFLNSVATLIQPNRSRELDFINGFGRASPGFSSDPPIGSGRARGSLHKAKS